jgi:predicted phosphodiesterase
MKILFVSDEECPALWEYYTPGKLKPYDLIISCGDLKASYLSFLVTMARCPVLYVHGNHDTRYPQNPPLGCDCIDDGLVVYNGLRILGLGGCRKYNSGSYQYTEAQMRRRIRKLYWKIRRVGGVDLVVTHAPAEGLGDAEDPAHWGFNALRELLDRYKPKYMCHGHVHMNYGHDISREIEYNGTRICNCTERYELDIPELPHPTLKHNELIWKTKYKDPYPSTNRQGYSYY